MKKLTIWLLGKLCGFGVVLFIVLGFVFWFSHYSNLGGAMFLSIFFGVLGGIGGLIIGSIAFGTIFIFLQIEENTRNIDNTLRDIKEK